MDDNKGAALSGNYGGLHSVAGPRELCVDAAFTYTGYYSYDLRDSGFIVLVYLRKI